MCHIKMYRVLEFLTILPDKNLTLDQYGIFFVGFFHNVKDAS